MGQPLAPSVRGQIAVYLAGADTRCYSMDHAAIVEGGFCPHCRLTLGDYVRALDVVTWP